MVTLGPRHTLYELAVILPLAVRSSPRRPISHSYQADKKRCTLQILCSVSTGLPNSEGGSQCQVMKIS